MKVYTVQDKDFLEFADSNGFILPNIKENLEPDLEDWLKDMSDVYFWMAEKYHEKQDYLMTDVYFGFILE